MVTLENEKSDYHEGDFKAHKAWVKGSVCWIKKAKQFLLGTHLSDNQWKNITTQQPLNKTKHAKKAVKEESQNKTRRPFALKYLQLEKQLLSFLRYHKQILNFVNSSPKNQDLRFKRVSEFLRIYFKGEHLSKERQKERSIIIKYRYYLRLKNTNIKVQCSYFFILEKEQA